MKHIQLFEKFTGSHNDALAAANALIDLTSFYDGYASENGVEANDTLWGNMETLNAEIDATIGQGSEMKIKTADDVIKNWDALESIAKKIVQGCENYLAKHGEADRYIKNAYGKISKVKKLFGIKD